MRGVAAAPAAIRDTAAKAAPLRAHARAGSSQPCAPSRSVANASVATPPQHWPSAGREREADQPCRGSGRSRSASRARRIASNSRWPPPMVPSRVASADDHRGAGFARRRPRDVRDDHERCAASLRERALERIDPAGAGTLTRRAPRARCGNARVRGLSGGAARLRSSAMDSRMRSVRRRRVEARDHACGRSTLATASRSAWNADSASMNGGSPTALERWIVSSRLGSSKKSTRKRCGHIVRRGNLVGRGRMRAQLAPLRSTTAPPS